MEVPEDRRDAIEAEIMRKVKVEAGHRCAIPTCRQTPIEIHHIKAWKEVREHKFDNLIALCPTCHARAGKGEIDRLSILTYKRNLAKISQSTFVAETLSEKVITKSYTLKLKDEIYIDRNRIKSYGHQAELRNLLNHLPNWVEKSLDRLTLLNKQNDYARIVQIVQFLHDTNDISEGRPNRQGKGVPQFWIENCVATRAYFKINNNIGFGIWVSHEDEQENAFSTQEEVQNFKAAGQDVGEPGKLFLLENFESKDGEYIKRFSSPYSFVYELGWIVKQKISNAGNQKQIDTENFSQKFAKEPLLALESLGATIYQKRKISVLYKIRNLFPEFYCFGRYEFTTIAYPLLIIDNQAEHNLRLQDIVI